MMETPMLSGWLDQAIMWFCRHFESGTFFYYDHNVRSLLAVVLVSLACGAVGSLVVGNRMAFFSDALAHSAFAGVAIGILMAFLLRLPRDELFHWITPVMAAFGVVVGLAIFVIRERTSQSNDTVIGV